MTDLEFEALQFLDRQIDRTGRSPSFDQIGAAIGLKSKSSVHRVVWRLIDLGHLRRTDTRTLVVVKDGASRFAGVTSAELRAELLRRGEAVE